MKKKILDILILKIIDRYILKKYILSTVFALLVFIVMSVSIDYSEKTEEFSNPKLTLKEILIYYLCFIPHIASLLLPIFVFISTIIFTSKMAMRTEFIPMFSSGIKMLRLLKPYVLGGFIFGFILWYANLDWLPELNKTKSEFLVKYVDGRREGDYLNNISLKVDSNRVMDISTYQTLNDIGLNVSIYTFQQNELTNVIRADSLIWNDSLNSWTLKKIQERIFKNKKEIMSKKDSMPFLTFITPADFKKDDYLKEKLTKSQLRTKIKQEILKGSNQVNLFKIELYKRDSTPFSIIILSIIAGIVASKKVRGGTGLNIAIGILISVSLVLLDRVSSVFSINANLPPLLAAWLPNVIFIFVCFVLLKKSQQ